MTIKKSTLCLLLVFSTLTPFAISHASDVRNEQMAAIDNINQNRGT